GEIRELHQRLQTTSVYVTHDQIEAMTMADRIVVMHDGVVEQAGTPLEIYDRPANVFVAAFIGSPAMNLLPGRLAEDASAVELAGGARRALAQRATAPAGTEVQVGVRPEHLELNGQGLNCEVVVVEPTGADTQVIARCAAGDLVASFRERHHFRPGAPANLA